MISLILKMNSFKDTDIKLFWNCVRNNTLSNNLISDDNSDMSIENQELLDILNDIHRQLIIKGTYAIADYFNNNSINDTRFYQTIDDPYDGISMSSDVIIDFIDSLIMSGKDNFDNFCVNPFKGDVMYYLSRIVSCGNSSCLTFNECCNKRWYYLLNTDYDENLSDTDFCNYIFNIVYK